MVPAGVHATLDRRKPTEVLFDGTSASVLDCGAALDDAGGHGGALVGRLLKGGSQQRARCAKVIFVGYKRS
jgi:hypothetical protein